MKVMLRIPTNSGVEGPLTDWLHWLGREHMDIAQHYTAGYGIAHARNMILREFLDSDCTHLWFVDSDTVPPMSLTLLSHDLPSVCGPYESFRLDRGLHWNVFREGTQPGTYSLYRRQDWPDEPFHASATGLGCALLRRDVFDKLPKDPFHFEEQEGEWIGEDFSFFRDIGGTMVDPHYVCQHIKKQNLTAIHDTIIKGIVQ
jgi:hypothetical protein